MTVPDLVLFVIKMIIGKALNSAKKGEKVRVELNEKGLLWYMLCIPDYIEKSKDGKWIRGKIAGVIKNESGIFKM